MHSFARLSLAAVALASLSSVNAASDPFAALGGPNVGLPLDVNQVPLPGSYSALSPDLADTVRGLSYRIQIEVPNNPANPDGPKHLAPCYETVPASDNYGSCFQNGVLYPGDAGYKLYFNADGVELVKSPAPGALSLSSGYLEIDESGSGAITLSFPPGISFNTFDGAEIAVDKNDAGDFFIGLGTSVTPGVAIPATISAGYSSVGCTNTPTPPTLTLEVDPITNAANGQLLLNVLSNSFDPTCALIWTWDAKIDHPTPCRETTCGDPQFNGFLGQSFQVHGVSGTVYNVISTPNVQLNALFTYLESGKCRAGTTCFGHPGNYFGEVGLMVKDEAGAVGRLRVVAGPVDQGLTVLLNDVALPVSSRAVSFGLTSVTLSGPFEVEIATPEFSLRLQNSDMFLNEDVSINSKLMDSIMSFKRASKAGNATDVSSLPHGLLGQTWQRKTYPNRWKHIEGQLFDYAVADGLLGTEFKFNRF